MDRGKLVPNGAVPEARDMPSMQNMYASDYWTSVKKDELQRGTRTFMAAQAPFETGYVPNPAYASMFADPNTQVTTKPTNFVSSLTGEQIPLEQFTHNNMQPYFRGTVKQNTNPEGNSVLMENFTGRGDFMIQKQETKCFFEPTANLTNICGMPNNNDYYVSHMEEPKARRNDFPVEKIMVGPGLNKGYNATPSGGFQQADTRDYVRYKTVDELRPLSKPKTVMPSRPQGPIKAPNTQRGSVGEFAKNRPDTYYEQSADQWLHTTGAYIKDTSRPVQLVKPTARVETHKEYTGNATVVASKPGMGYKDDYGKSAINVYDNERTTTETKTVVSNITSVVKAIIAPFLDIVRNTPKEYTLDASRTFGNMSAQIPNKPTLYDPVNHVMKTTVKETTIHDAQVGNARAQIPEKATLYDPVNHIMRTTIKETTIHDAQVANLKGPNEATLQLDDNAKTTTRETLPVYDTMRNISGHTYRVIVYNPDEVAKTTVKETTLGAKNEFGYVTPINSEGAYTYIKVDVPNTQKQFVSDNDHYGVSRSVGDFRPVSNEASLNAQIDGTREAINIAAGHTPNGAGGFTSLDPEKVALDVKKTIVDSLASRAMGNVTRISQVTPKIIDKCELTRGVPEKATHKERGVDGSLLTALKSNPYNLSINPVVEYDCA